MFCPFRFLIFKDASNSSQCTRSSIIIGVSGLTAWPNVLIFTTENLGGIWNSASHNKWYYYYYYRHHYYEYRRIYYNIGVAILCVVSVFFEFILRPETRLLYSCHCASCCAVIHLVIISGSGIYKQSEMKYNWQQNYGLYSPNYIGIL